MAPISISLALGHTAVQAQGMLQLGAGHLARLRVSLPCSSQVLNAKQGNSMYHIFQVFGMTRPGIEHRPTEYKASTLPLPQPRIDIGVLVDFEHDYHLVELNEISTVYQFPGHSSLTLAIFIVDKAWFWIRSRV